MSAGHHHTVLPSATALFNLQHNSTIITRVNLFNIYIDTHIYIIKQISGGPPFVQLY